MLSTIITIVLVLTTLALIGLILIQHGKGGGLAGAFGGGGVEQAFGTRATTVAQKATAILGAVYLLLCIMLGVIRGVPAKPVSAANPDNTPLGQPMSPASPVAPATPSPAETK